MQLQGRNLSFRMRGEDVKVLQEELNRLEFIIEDEAGYFGRSTRQAVIEFQRQHDLEQTGEVDERTAVRINASISLSVSGHVHDHAGKPLAGITVVAFHQAFRAGPVLLGEVRTNRAGYYEILYSLELPGDPDRQKANLFVRAYDKNGNIIASS
jgi:peptidoglycan hydrolase-like protein with peptidoglycan-binding domain